MNKRKTDVLFIILSLIIGAVLGFFEEIIYSTFLFEFSRVACITIYLAIFAVVFGVILLFKSLIGSAFDKIGKVLAFTLLAMIAFVGCSALFEFLYELGDGIPDSKPNPDKQYVFLIDDSDSMTWEDGDPTNQRYASVQNIINTMKPTKDFAVYSFDSDIRLITPMGTADSATYKISEPYYGGGTNLEGALERVMNDVASANGKHTKIVTLTDCEVSVDKPTIDRCISNNVSVSFVVFGTKVTGIAEDIATKTGGTFEFANNVSNLDENLNTIMQAQAGGPSVDRDLLGARNDATRTSVLYALLRILFLSLLGVIWTIAKLLLVGKKCTKSSIVISIVLCALGAIFCEVFTLLPIVPGRLVRMLFCALWACTVIPTEVYSPIIISSQLSSGPSNIGTNTAKTFDEIGKGGGTSKSFL